MSLLHNKNHRDFKIIIYLFISKFKNFLERVAIFLAKKGLGSLYFNANLNIYNNWKSDINTYC
jgi:hypothetical protein